MMNGVIRGMNNVVYAEWGDFQIRPPTYLDGHFEPDEYDIVKWVYYDKPQMMRGWGSKKLYPVEKTCFSIGFLIWDPKELHFKFKSVGTRYLEERKDGLEKFILDFCEKESTKRVWKNMDGDE